MKLNSLNQNRQSWIFEDNKCSIELSVTNESKRKEARKYLKRFIDKIKKRKN